MIEKYLNNRALILYLLPLFIGGLTVFSFEPFNFTLINFIVLPLFFFLIVFINKKSKSTYRKKPYRKNLFILGTAFGFGFYLGNLHWIAHSLTFDNSFKILIPVAIIFIPLFLSLFFSIVTLLVGPFLNLNFNSIILFAGSLSLSDYLRAKILTGFPWNLWAYSFSSFTEIIQILEIVGLFTFNLIIITIFMLPAIIFLRVNFFSKAVTFTSIIVTFIFLYIYGDHSINNNDNIERKEKFNIKVVSPNFKLEYGISLSEVEKRLNKLIKYSEPNKEIKTLFVWPEGVFSGYSFKEVQVFQKKFENEFSKKHYILFGINRLDEQKKRFFNSLIILNNQMQIMHEYNKQKLVPFGEFIPFEKKLNKLGLKKITEGYGSFLKGNKQGNIIFDGLNILPLICYEIIFTKLIQQSDKNTNLIINISEDGWFGNSIGPYQHFSKGIFRAIEQNAFLIRSANKGISAIINNKGQVIKKLEPSEIGNIELEVPLVKSSKKNKNDLIFFILLFTYIFIFKFNKNNYGK